MKCTCITVDGKKIYFQVLGKGPALVLLHPSPHNANMMVPLAKELASTYTVFCMDTPGYGRSDGLTEPPKDLSEYTTRMHKAFKAMGLEQLALYGSATGAQLAIRYAIENPDTVTHIFLDNAAHFDDDLRSAILESYFPDLTPVRGGHHLHKVWDIVSHIFRYFPWCFKTPEYALNRQQLPKEALHFIALDFLRAGATYDWAYKAAFEHERASYVQQLKVPTTIFRWEGSIITKHIDRLLSFTFPPHVNPFMIKGSPEERNAIMTRYMKEKASGTSSVTLLEKLGDCAEKETIAYDTSALERPSVTPNGDYLNQAWKLLENANPKLNAAEIQMALIDWYSKS